MPNLRLSCSPKSNLGALLTLWRHTAEKTRIIWLCHVLKCNFHFSLHCFKSILKNYFTFSNLLTKLFLIFLKLFIFLFAEHNAEFYFNICYFILRRSYVNLSLVFDRFLFFSNLIERSKAIIDLDEKYFNHVL